ncbi:hypothetical protein EMIHUDRAFT_232089 [Emiliania huxleyi CCMP1516]|uniref:Fungal lipase-like domain-containing protein n=2 Tax=Emiliania huxleyi TaxID=2903 RepID=A0A0D3K6C8_EMIH1|nr:hypothetical protein EMIHUDRAFT_232089 [Emiliania huxleyi CCMP1516]EOD31313.1 hypothetical protein EMIHUDRAFT_232089 [Emiliania huxleyi CCMP1516]|eukprot:XP_005783742.1 hypothetical protein EMIHUDRAFT_232089 [Emiliania huxleyi CCMP1516]
MCKCVCTALWVALLAAPVAAANDWRRWISQAADSLSHASRAELSLPRVDGGERLSPAELEAPLLGARLSWLAYAEKRREVEAGLALLGSGMELVRFSPQRDSKGAQWLVARDAESGTLWVAFRGTASLADVELREVVEAELRVRPCERLALCGHSLGGALAMTLLGAGLLPCASGDAGYAHWPGGELVYLDPAGGGARRVPRAQRDRVLHLHRAVHPDAAAHHKCYFDFTLTR